MTEIPDISDTGALLTLSESAELECRAAQGKNGRGELPVSFWESYSAMANSHGGEIFLGIEESPRGVFHVIGLKDPEPVRKAIWDNLHNRKQVSANIFQERDIAVVSMEGRAVIRVHVPQAQRQQRPVHLRENPFGNTFLRRHDG